MAAETGISWCDSTFNPFIGCTKVSPACDNCYASVSTPVRAMKVGWGPGKPRHRTSESTWRQPLVWERQHAEFFQQHGRRRRVFCASLADVFDNEVDPQWRDDLFYLIEQTPNLDWLLLTKRIGNARAMIQEATSCYHLRWPWPNVWIGATIANQEEADRDIPKLLATPARVRFLSCEPLLSDIDLTPFLWGRARPCPCCTEDADCDCGFQPRIELDDEPAIHWVISGAESGGKARTSHPDWFRSLRDQCEAAGVAFHHKQHGEWVEVAADEKDEHGKALQIEVGSNAAKLEWRRRTDCLITLDGSVYDNPDSLPLDTPARLMRRVGKKAAGRTLDGVIHDGFPTT